MKEPVLKKRLWHWCFAVNFAKFLRTPFLQNTSGRLLLRPHDYFNKAAGLRPATLLKKRLWHRSFLVNFAKFLKTPFLTEDLRWLLLSLDEIISV